MCDCLVALPAATGTVTLFAKNSDRPPAEVQRLEWSAPRHDTKAIDTTYISVAPHRDTTFGVLLSRPLWCWGAEHGVNTAGLAVGNEAIYTTLDPRTAAAALIGMDLVRLALERSADAATAVDVITSLVQRYGQGGSGHDPALVPAGRPYWSSFLVADPRSAFVIETSGRLCAVEPVVAVRAISNRTTIPSFDAGHRHPRQPVERLVDPRLEAGRRMLTHRRVTVDALAEHLRSHDSCVEPGWSVCMHVDGVEETTASLIAEMPTDRPPLARTVCGHPCEQRYATWTVDDDLERQLPAAP